MRPPVSTEDSFALVSVGVPLPSYDAQYVVTTQSRWHEPALRRVTERHVIDTRRPEAPMLELGAEVVLMCWAPDRNLLWVVGDGGGVLRALVLDDGSRPEEIPLVVKPSELHVSPNGRLAALVCRRPLSPPDLGLDLSSTPQQRRPFLVSHTEFRSSTGEPLPEVTHELFIMDLSTGATRQVNWPGGAYPDPTEDVSGCDLAWSHDSASVVVSLSTGWDDRFDLPARRRDLYRIDVAAGTGVALTDGDSIDRSPTVSPATGEVAFLRQRGEPTAHFPYFMDACLVDPRSGAVSNLSAELDVDVWSVAWLDTQGLCITYPASGSFVTARLEADGTLTSLTTGALPEVRTGGGAVGVVRREPGRADAPAVLRAEGLQALGEPNCWVEDRQLATTQQISYPSAHVDLRQIHAVVAVPAGVDDPSTLPVVINLHGGPYALATSGFSLEREVLAAHGYVVVEPNYRGSAGFGEEHARLGAWHRYPGTFDHPEDPTEMGLDVVGALDAIRDQGLGDPNRVFLRGFSAGALLTTWAIGRTDRFCAAVAESWYPGEWSGCNYNWFQLRYYFDGEPWQPSHTIEYWRSSPIMLAGQVQTPLLIMQGARDHVTPLLEAEKYYYALRSRGVEVALAVYPDEGHGISWHPASHRDRMLMEIAWFGEHDPAR